MALSVLKYNLKLNFIQKDRFKGICTIGFKFDGGTLILDARELEIGKLLVNGKEARFAYDEKKRKISIENMGPAEGKIQITYAGKYSEGLSGLYRAGKGEREMITTQFEPNFASFAFPCFDNPALKAMFELTAIVNGDMDAISNMPQETNKKMEDGSREIKFQQTPLMPTYLLYIGVGKFVYRAIKHGDSDIILAVPGSDIRSDDFPLEVAGKVVSFYEKYFNIPYALPKMHLIAVPDMGGAMENWGAITFAESVLLNDKNTDSEAKILIAVVIAHEIAHQWFGNLVTMKWWNDLWLNESFATFMSSLSINSIFPEYEEEKTYYIDETVGSMLSDSLKSSHPIDVEVKEPEDIEQIFDDISYGKGGSVLRMIYHYMGNENFKTGLSSYLKKYKYGNAEGSDLWHEFEKSSKLKISSIMENWISQSGHPLVKVDWDGRKLKLEQKQFLLQNENTEKIWKIPIFIETGTGEKTMLMESKEMETEIDGFIKINSRGTGYYQTLYSERTLANLKEKTDMLDPMDIAELVSDSYFQFLSGELPAEKYLEFSREAAQSFSTPSALLLANNFERLNTILYDKSEFLKSSNSLIEELIRSGDAKNTDSSQMDRIGLKHAKVAYAIINHEYAINESRKFNDYFKLDPDDREYVVVAKAAVSNGLNEMAEKLKDAKTESDAETIIMAMGWIKGKKNHKQIIKMFLRGDVKKEYIPGAVLTMIRNPDSRKYICSILLPLLRNLSKGFGSTGILSRAAYAAIPLLGLENEAKVRKVMSKLNYNEIRMGYDNGFELLEVYKKLRNSAN